MGLFITLEGGEGAGKSTQSKLIADYLGNSLLTREPGGTKAAEWLRSFILSGKAKSWGSEAEAVLFATARYSHMRDKILPTLNAGKNVICDRFIDSTRAYQNIEPAIINSLEAAAIFGRIPDLTFILDLPAEIGLARALNRSKTKDRFEAESLAFHEALRLKFLEIAKANPQRCHVIDASQEIQKISADILKVIADA